MIEKRQLAIKSRKKDLDDKYLECDPLPDPEDEKDLNTFLTLWREAPDKDIEMAVTNSQTAEQVIKTINGMLGEALTQYDYDKINWCHHYIKQIRDTISDKYDQISAQILTYIENYWKYTDEEIEALLRQAGSRRPDTSQKPEIKLMGQSEDIVFALWANIQAKSKQH